MVVRKQDESTIEVPAMKDKLKTLMVVGGVLGVLLLGFFVTNMVMTSKVANAKATNVALQNKLTMLETKNEEVIRKVAYTDLDGLTANQVSNDKNVLIDFFKPAFQYQNGKEYDAIRNQLVGTLGENNSFVSYYLPENEAIENSTRVDLEGVKTQFKDATLYPVEKVSNGYRYIAVMSFVYYKTASDLSHLDALHESHAIVRCDVVAESANQKNTNYHIENVSGYGGY